MDIGTQRESLVYLTDNHWGRLRKWVTGAIMTLLLTLFTTLTPAQAAVETIAPVGGGYYTLHHIGGSYSTPSAACEAWFVALGPGYNSYRYEPAPYYNAGYCEARSINNGYSAGNTGFYVNATCPTATPAYSFNPASGKCERPVQACPVHSSGTFPNACVCDTGYKVDAAGTSCVPDCPANASRSDLLPFFGCVCHTGYKFGGLDGICVPLRECTIPDLPPITDTEVQLFEDNPDRADTARLSPRMKIAYKCLLDDAAAVSPTTGSAFRPTAYNQHLIDLWKKWREFRTDINYDQQDCAARKEKIRLHFKTHKLKETQTPVPNSRHTRGEAVDVTIKLPAANIDALAAKCKLHRPEPVNDDVHFIHQ